MKVLITGAKGFVARHLQKKLEQNDEIEVYLTTHSELAQEKSSQVLYMDLRKAESIDKILSIVKPDVIVHLAAQSNVPFSWENPVETLEVNVLGTTKIIQSLCEQGLSSKLVIVGSSDEYGITAKSRQLLNEEDPCFPQNPYAISKLAAGQLALKLSKKNDMEIVYLRPFNHFGPGQRKGFVVSDFCSQIASIEQGLIKPVIQVGDISTYRDFSPIHDIVTAYELAIKKNIPSGIYNISSGRPLSIESILDKLLSLSTSRVSVIKDKKRFRPAEVKSFAGDGRKFKNATGWLPSYDIDSCLLETLNWWREKVKKRAVEIF